MSGAKWLFRSGSQIHKTCLPTLLVTAKLQEERGNGPSLIHLQDNLKIINLRLSSSATQQVSVLLSCSRNLLIYWCCIHYCFSLGMSEYAKYLSIPGTHTHIWKNSASHSTLNQGSYGDKINFKTLPHMCSVLCTPFVFMSAQGLCRHASAKGDCLHL